MELSTLYNFYNTLQNDNLSLAYQGEFSDDMTEKLIGLSEYHIENVEELKKSKKKISFLIAESFQNIVRHSDEINKNKLNKIGVFFIRNIARTYFITSANIVENKNIEMLKSTITKVNSLGAEELKELYMNVLSKEKMSEKGGAGLGLIEMARKSGHKLDYDFEKIDNIYSYFYLQVRMHNSPENDDGLDNAHALLTVKFLRKKINDENILLIYKGDFSEDSILPVLKMIKDNMEKKEEGFITQKRVYMVLVEMLQNVSKHSLAQNGMQSGIMMIGKRDEHYIIHTGNLTETEKTEELKKRIDRINQASKDELSIMHTKTLVEGNISEKGGAGLGLMDIAKKSSDKLNCSFFNLSNSISFFGLSAQV